MKRWLVTITVAALWGSTLIAAQEARRRPIVVPTANISLVQTAVSAGTGTNSQAAVYAVTPTSGNLLIAVGRSTSSAIGNASITGWTLANSVVFSSSNSSVGLWYKVAGGGESTTVTLNWTTANNVQLSITEWAGVSVLDQIASTASDASNVSSRSSGTTPTTTAANELLLTACSTSSTVSAESWSNSFNVSFSYDARFFGGYKIVSATGTYESTLSWTTVRAAGCLIATFK